MNLFLHELQVKLLTSFVNILNHLSVLYIPIYNPHSPLWLTLYLLVRFGFSINLNVVLSHLDSQLFGKVTSNLFFTTDH